MDSERLANLLERVRRNRVSVAEAMARLRHLPFEDLGFAKIDHHRALRQGFPEVVMGDPPLALESSPAGELSDPALGRMIGHFASAARTVRR